MGVKGLTIKHLKLFLPDGQCKDEKNRKHHLKILQWGKSKSM